MNELTYLIGNLGSDPVERVVEGKGTVLAFSVARPNGFGKDAPQPTWFDVGIWNDSVREQAKRELFKGTSVAVIGVLKERKGETRTFRSVNALRVMLTHPILPVRTDMWPENSKPKPQVSPLKQKTDDDQDLGF